MQKKKKLKNKTKNSKLTIKRTLQEFHSCSFKSQNLKKKILSTDVSHSLFSVVLHFIDSDMGIPASVQGDVIYSKTFQILYKNEEIVVNDVLIFKVMMLLDERKVRFIFIYIKVWLKGQSEMCKFTCEDRKKTSSHSSIFLFFRWKSP